MSMHSHSLPFFLLNSNYSRGRHSLHYSNLRPSRHVTGEVETVHFLEWIHFYNEYPVSSIQTNLNAFHLTLFIVQCLKRNQMRNQTLYHFRLQKQDPTPPKWCIQNLFIFFFLQCYIKIPDIDTSICKPYP